MRKVFPLRVKQTIGSKQNVLHLSDSKRTISLKEVKATRKRV